MWLLECSWGEKENKRREIEIGVDTGHLCGGEKKKKKWNMYGWKWNERKRNNIKKIKKKILIEKYYHNIFTINFK